jgi:L-seryl-tRNA(Ser) seleniumtransferase
MKNAVQGILSRRDLFRRGGLIAAGPTLLSGPHAASAAVPATAGKLQLNPDIYRSIGVRPLINFRGTLTVISGSLELPEVRAASILRVSTTSRWTS